VVALAEIEVGSIVAGAAVFMGTAAESVVGATTVTGELHATTATTNIESDKNNCFMVNVPF
jgi:hypothetical protein